MIDYEKEIRNALKFRIESDEVYASEIGKCIRQSWFYRNFVLSINPSGVSADLGVSIHSKVQEYFTKQFNCVAEVRKEIETEGLKLVGKADLICGEDLIELKTVINIPLLPLTTHIYQLTAYSMLFDNVKKYYIVYIQRSNGAVKVFMYTKEELQQGADIVIDWIKKLKSALNETDVNKVPPNKNEMCKYCPFRHMCP